jgi:hypothetical protein
MLATELLFVYIYCLVDDAIKAGALLIPRRPGPAPACTDAELLTIALVQEASGSRPGLAASPSPLAKQGRTSLFHGSAAAAGARSGHESEFASALQSACG